MIDHVILWANGMVMVFDHGGKQMNEYQGMAADALPKVLRDAPESTRWEMGVWGQGKHESTREAMVTNLRAAQSLKGKAEAATP